MVDRVRLDADPQPLLNALRQGTAAWERFLGAETRVIKESAKLGRAGVIITRSLQSIDSQGRKVTATFRGTAGAMQLVSTSVKDTSRAVDAAAKSTNTLGDSLQSIRRAVGFSLLFRSVTALQQALTEGTENAIEFSRRIAEVETIQGSVRLTTQQWSDNLRELSDSFGIDILNQAEAAYQTLSNQVAKGRDTFVFLEAANKLALTAVTDTASSVNLLTSAINAYGLDASQAEQLSAQFFKTVELGRVRIGELSEIFGRVGVPAAQLGIGLDEVQASIAAITVQGVRSEEALTLIRNVILKLIRPTDEMKRVFQELGIANAEAGIAAFGFGGLLARIEQNVGGTTSALGKAFGRVRALTGALVFASDTGAKAFNEALEALNDPGLLDSFEKNFQNVFTSNGEVIRRETNRLRNFFQVELGQEVLKAVADFTREFGGVGPVIESVSRIIRTSMAPALALLTVRLLATARASVAAAGGLRALALSNPFSAVLVAGVTAISLYNEFSDSAERSAERVRKAQEDLTNSLAVQNQERRKELVREIDLTVKALQLGTRAFIAPLTSDVVGKLNRDFGLLNENAKAFNKEVQAAANESLKAADQVLKQTSSFLTELSKTAKSAGDEIKQSTETTGEEIFRIRVDSSQGIDAVSIIGRRIEELERIRQAAVRQGDRETFNDAQKEIRALIIERGELLRSVDKSLSSENRVNLVIQERKNLLEEENRLRRQLIEQVNVQESAARKVRVEQELLQKDLQTALTTFRNNDLTEALGGGDEDQIRRALAERQSATQRLVTLQKQLGITQISNAEIQESQQRDLENSINRINVIRAQALIDERNQLDDQIEARLKAAKEETVERQESLNQEIEKLSRLRTALGAQIQLESFPQSNITGGTDTTALGVATGLGAVSDIDALSEALQPTVNNLNELIGLLQRDPTRVTPEQRARATELRGEIVSALENLRTPRGETLTRADLETALQNRLGQQIGGEPLFGAAPRVSSEQIQADVEAVLSVFDALKEGQETLNAGTTRLLDANRELAEAEEQRLRQVREVKDAELARLNALKVSTDATVEEAKQRETVSDLIARRNALSTAGVGTQSAGDLGLDPTSVMDATKAATPELTESYKEAVRGAAPEIKQAQIDAVLAAEKERQRLAETATAGPNAAKNAAEEATKSGVLSRKIAAENRAAERKAANDEARRIQDERIRAANEAREIEEERAQNNKADIEARRQLQEQGLLADQQAAEEALRAANQADLNRRFGEGDQRSTTQSQNPLAATGPTGPGVTGEFGQEIGTAPLEAAAEGGLQLATSLDTAASNLDLFNESIQTFLNAQIAAASLDQRRIGETDSAIKSFTFTAQGATVELESITQRQKEAATAVQAFTRAVERETQRLQDQQFVDDVFTGRLGFNSGGQVPGTGSTDTVPAMVTPGEYIMNKESTRRFLPDLIRMNNYKPRRYQDGGAVGSINFGGFNVNEAENGQTTALEIQRIINRGIRQGIIKLKG